MNIREGVKRIYLLFGAIGLAIGAFAIIKELPSADRIYSRTEYQVRQDVAKQLEMDSWNVTSGSMTDKEFVETYCNKSLIYGKGDTQKLITPNQLTCDVLSQQLKDLPKEKFTEGMYGVGYLVLGFLGLSIFFFVSRWVFNGFFPKQ